MGYMRHLASQHGTKKQLHVDSCGLHAHFLGSAPDQRMQSVAHRRGVFFDHRAQLFETAFFDLFQAIFGVTKEVVSHLRLLAHNEDSRAKVYLASDFSRQFRGLDIPDPYYLGDWGFEENWEMIEDCCLGIYEFFIMRSRSK